MAYELPAPNTGASLESADSDSLRALWEKTVTLHEAEEDFFTGWEGKREDSLIETVTTTAQGKGHRVTFTSMAGFHQEGKHGDEVFEETEDFEPWDINSNTLYVDFIRNATSQNARAEVHMGLQNELRNKVPRLLGEWLGRKKNRAMWMMYRTRGNSKNLMIAGGGANVDALAGTHTLSWDDCVNVGSVLKENGAKPAFMGDPKKYNVRRYCIAGENVALASLKKDDQYLEALETAGVDGPMNELFTGGFADVDGHIIREYRSINHGEDGTIGSPINPKLKVSAAISSPSSGFTITGGSNSRINYTQDFPNFDFKFNASDQLSVSGSPTAFYLLIVNPPTAPTDPGKMAFCKCLGNDGNAITVTEWLTSSASGGGFDLGTVGDVTWNTGVWSGKHTETIAAGATAYLANSKGQPYGYTLFAGGCSARRAYGSNRNTRVTDSKEGGFINQSFLVTEFGQAPTMNAAGNFPNFMMLAHSLQYPGSPIPQNIT